MDIKFAIIDTEGFAIKTGGSKRSKLTTIWICKVFLLVWCCLEKQIVFEREWNIAMPISWNELDKKIKDQWNFTHAIHNTPWNCMGTKYKDCLSEIKKQIRGVEVWAKGKFLEDRFLNNKGMYGASICQRTWCGRDIHVNELNDFRFDKFDCAMYKYYKGLQDSGIVLAPLGRIVISNYENGKPLPHSPRRECEYFLGELLKIKGIQL